MKRRPTQQADLFHRPPTKVDEVKEAVGTDHVRFDGAEYIPRIDDERLSSQLLRVFFLMKDAQFRNLHQMAVATGDPEASISAQLRHLRKEKFGGHTVNRRPSGNRAHGLFEYQLIVRKHD